MLNVAIIVGSTRPNRKGNIIARWVYEVAKEHKDANFEIVDVVDFNLPLLDEPLSPAQGQYSHMHTRIWSAKISNFDAFIFVTPEYNHGIPAALKNAIDYLYHEWNNKAAGFVSYGFSGGTRAVEQLRLVMAELQIADVRAQVELSLYHDFEKFKIFKPLPHQTKAVHVMVEQILSWGEALQQLRQNKLVMLPQLK